MKLTNIKTIKADKNGFVTRLLSDVSGNLYVSKTTSNLLLGRELERESRLLSDLKNNSKVHMNTFEKVSFSKNGFESTLVTKYLKHSPLRHTSVANQIREWKRVVALLQSIDTKSVKMRFLQRKTVRHFALIAPVIYLLAILKNKDNAWNILKTLPVYIHGVAKNWNNKNLVLVHGDLHPKNILLSGRKTYVTDFAQTSITYPEYELITTLASVVTPRSMREEIMRELIARGDSRLLIQVLLIQVNIHNLTGNILDKNRKHYLSLLNWTLTAL